MKKMNLILVACLFVASLNAQLLSVPSPIKSVLTADATSDLKIMKMNRSQKQVSRITMGETLFQISVLKQKKAIVLSILNANPSMKFIIEDELGHVLTNDKINSNIIRTYDVGKLEVGDYSLTLSGSGITAKRFFTVTNAQITLRDDVDITSQTNK